MSSGPRWTNRGNEPRNWPSVPWLNIIDLSFNTEAMHNLFRAFSNVWRMVYLVWYQGSTADQTSIDCPGMHTRLYVQEIRGIHKSPNTGNHLISHLVPIEANKTQSYSHGHSYSNANSQQPRTLSLLTAHLCTVGWFAKTDKAAILKSCTI